MVEEYGPDDFTQALNALYEDAGRPDSGRIITRARAYLPKITVTASLLTEWRQGSVPRDENVVIFLVSYLTSLIGRPATPIELQRWKNLRAGSERARRRERKKRRTSSAGPAAAGGTALPVPLAGLLRVMQNITDDLPYPLRGVRRIALSGVYVRQAVAEPARVRTVRPDGADGLDWGAEQQLAPEQRVMSGLVQPFEDAANQHDHLVIQGEAGLGKSTLGRQMTEAVLDGVAAPVTEPAIAVMVPARTLAGRLNSPWSVALRDCLVGEYGMFVDGDLAESMFLGPVAGHRWWVIVDALDEIPEPSKRQQLLAALAAKMTAPEGSVRFLVTTRPLASGEIAKLHGPRVGFYDLQPFDDDALADFAGRWFNPDNTETGAAAAAEFLHQVRVAGLQELVQVPLLATVAAHVHQTHRDRRLPASRYELYQQYIDQFGQARDRSTTELLRRLHEVPGGEWLAEWLLTHRQTLLEHLAVTSTTSEAPLLAVAQQLVTEQAPLTGALPPTWTRYSSGGFATPESSAGTTTGSASPTTPSPSTWPRPRAPRVCPPRSTRTTGRSPS